VITTSTMSGRFLITGGVQRENAAKLQEGHRFYEARLLEIDFNNQATELKLAYSGNSGNYPDDFPNIIFTCSSLVKNKLYLCTETEIFIYSYPELNLLQSASYPFFQNIHHITPVSSGIAVASTGLDLVVILDKDSLQPIEFINSLGKDPWHRFPKGKDMRKVNSTKPHESHPNFIFELNGEPWASRFNQRDAVCLYDLTKRIDISVERIHDGHLIGDYIYFTAVDGRIVIANSKTYKIEEIINLNEMEDDNSPLGWCRGLAIDGDIAYVGFSRLRQTSIKENVRWILNFVGKDNDKDTHIVAYDMKKKKKLSEYTIPADMSNVIYSVIPLK